MFTFGIFTTHLPYIAFVFFYAVFFLFGIEKAPAGDRKDEIGSAPEIVSFAADNIPGEDDIIYWEHQKCLEKQALVAFHFYEKEVSFPIPIKEEVVTADYCFSWFSRPPPAA